MFRTTINHRVGMTLIELLVVIVILGLLMVTAIPVLVPADERTGREAALTFTSAIARVKKRAVRKDGRAALTFAAIQDDFSSPTGSRLKSADLFVAQERLPYPLAGAAANVYEVFRDFDGSRDKRDHRVINVVIDKSQSADLKDLFPESYSHSCYLNGDDGDIFIFNWLQLPNQPLSGGMNNYPADYLDFGGSLPFPGSGSLGIWRGELRVSSFDYGNHRPHPVQPNANPPPHGIHTTSVDGSWDPTDWSDRIFFVGPPVKSASPPLTLPGNFVVDMTWSCLENELFCHSPPAGGNNPYFFQPDGRPLAGAGSFTCLTNFAAFRAGFANAKARGSGEEMQSVHVVFNELGEILRIEYPRNDGAGVYFYRDDLLPGDALFFLIGRADRAGNSWVADPLATPGANWQYADSRWVSIQQDGTVLISNTRVDARSVEEAMSDAIDGVRASRY